MAWGLQARREGINEEGLESSFFWGSCVTYTMCRVWRVRPSQGWTSYRSPS